MKTAVFGNKFKRSVPFRNRNEKYDYSNAEAREETVAALLADAGASKSPITAYWKKMRAYYDGDHEIRRHGALFTAEQDIPWEAAQSTDGFIHVESQIDTKVPDFEFSARDPQEYDCAKQRERVVRYICDVNALERKNAVNERRLNILGTAIYKVCWDAGQFDGRRRGEIVIDNPKPEQIFPDPSSATVDGCEYIGYTYRLHRQKAKRLFADEFAAKGLDFDEILAQAKSGAYYEYTGEERNKTGRGDDTVAVTEWWFRQPSDGEEIIKTGIDGKSIDISYRWKAGDIALCILVEGRELRYIPRYWKNTACSTYPFVIYTKIPKEDSVWGKSELETILPLIDASDRELAFAQLNSAFSSNDIILAEENALADDGELDNSPGAVWKLRPGMMGKIQRLGNSAYSETNLYNNSTYWRGIIQETTGNFDISQGSEPTRVTTASGIALLNERSQNRMQMKKVIKAEGFRRLYELCDRTALEYYDDERVAAIGASTDDRVIFRFEDMASYPKGADSAYLPQVDVRIHIGEGVAHSKAFTIQAVSELMRISIREDNYKLVESYIELIDLPMRQEICDILEKMYGEREGEESKGVKSEVWSVECEE